MRVLCLRVLLSSTRLLPTHDLTVTACGCPALFVARAVCCVGVARQRYFAVMHQAACAAILHFALQ